MAEQRRGWRFTLRALLLAMLWCATLLATYRFSFDSGRRLGAKEGYNRKLDGTTHIRVYYVGDLLPSYTFDELIEEVQKSSPETWDLRGGSGSASGFDTNQTIVVSHSGDVHSQIQARLAKLRTAVPSVLD